MHTHTCTHSYTYTYTYAHELCCPILFLPSNNSSTLNQIITIHCYCTANDTNNDIPKTKQTCTHHYFHICTGQAQVHDLKQGQSQEGSQLQKMLVDPAVNVVFQRMKSQLSDYKDKLEQAQSDLSAWKFTPDRSGLGRLRLTNNWVTVSDINSERTVLQTNALTKVLSKLLYCV